MSALTELLTRAEANAAARAAELATLTESRAALKEAEDDARQYHRRAVSAVVRLRGAIEAIRLLPEADEILADVEPAPAPVPASPPATAIAFVPALDHAPESIAPVFKPKPVARSVPTPAQPKPAAATAPAPGSPLARIIALGDEILVMLKKEREGATSSIEMADLVRSTRTSETLIKLAIDNLVSRGLVKSTRSANRGCVTVLITEAAA